MKRKNRMTPEARKRRKYWVSELAKLSGSFGDDSTKMIAELRAEIGKDGPKALLDHLRLCGAVPEHYGHDSSEEKLYSKYTDAIISESLTAIGLKSAVITARADAADVQARGGGYSLVADAKAFRLSRTAKNQKDFKVQAMDGWRNGLDYAVVVCPIYQLPSRTSQIYQQAIARNVCILSYSHLAALVGVAERRGGTVATKGLGSVLKRVSLLHPSKNAADYWLGINKALVAALKGDVDLWTAEKTASLSALGVAKDEALTFLRAERNRLLGLSHKQALEELIRAAGLDSRIAQVERIEHGNLLGD
ncbi:MAG: HindIII family type II restriction endonuclease [Deltaproteobacteria bacterium]|nr:HindIII family type II restriction endonuclease [Deltaproteobacteria bacterium]